MDFINIFDEGQDANLLPVIVAGTIIYFTLKWRLFAKIRAINSGEQRRALFPMGTAVISTAKEILSSDDIEVRQDLFNIGERNTMFCQVLLPKNKPATHIVIFFHGYGSNSDMYVEVLSDLVRQGACLVIPDLPGHGRSDGDLAYIPNWWIWVTVIWGLLDCVIPALQEELTSQEGAAEEAKGAAEEAKPKKAPLKVFGVGMSLGGGLVACLAMMRQGFFHGVVLVAPMLVVSDEMKPSALVTWLFRYVFLKLLPTWPVTPTADMAGLDFRVPTQGTRFDELNPLSMQVTPAAA